MHYKILERRMRVLQERDKKIMEQTGWVMHYFADKGQAHTHGLPEHFSHPDLQIVLPLGPNLTSRLFAFAVERIKDGVVFKSGERYKNVVANDNVGIVEFYEDVATNYDIEFIGCTLHDARNVLRLLIPDEQGRLPWDEGCESVHKQQLMHTCRPPAMV